ncbi:MAG: aldo/keto reductase [Spirochaetota bacterium]
MKYKKLGKNGPDVPVIGLGAWPIGGGMGSIDERTAVKTVQAAIDRGITLIDTAQGYLESEQIIGKALRNGYRERCFLATKVSQDFSARGIEYALNRSLKLLGVEYVDLYQVHRWDPEYPIEETMETISRFQKQGKIRYVGVSNFQVDQLQQASHLAPVVSNQVNYNLFLRSIEKHMVPWCRRHGIGLMVHSTLGKGILAGKYSRNHRFSEDDERSQFAQYHGENLKRYLDAVDDLKQLASGRNAGIVEFAVAWVLRLPEVSCALVGAKNPGHLEAPAKAAEITLTQEELDQVERILASHNLEELAPFKSQIV